MYNVVLRIFCTQVVRKARLDWQVAADPVKVVLRSALEVPGAQSVMTSGTMLRLLLFAGSLDYQLMVRLCVRNLYTCVCVGTHIIGRTRLKWCSESTKHLRLKADIAIS